MYEMCLEKNIKFEKKFNEDIFEKCKKIKKPWIFCYKLISDAVFKAIDYSIHDFRPKLETKIRIRISQEWIQPFALTTGTKIPLEARHSNAAPEIPKVLKKLKLSEIKDDAFDDLYQTLSTIPRSKSPSPE
jgi:hypothetical protein